MSHYKGLNNIGNTCYLNSGLQLLLTNHDLCKIVLNNRETSDKLKKFSEVILKYYSSDTSSITPSEVKSLVENRKSMFTGFKQHDSAEFIVYFLDLLITECKEISKLFEIESQSTVKCKLRVCLNKSITTVKDLYLMLYIKPSFTDLDDCYRDYKQHEKMDDDNMIFCEKCKDKRIGSKRVEIINWPKHLIVCLNRFDNTSGRLTKNNQAIKIPVKWRHNYILSGAVYHSGSLHGGHYIYITHNVKEDQWIMLNDSNVSNIRSDSVSNYLNYAYILYYVRCD